MQNYAVDNQDDINSSEMMEIGEIKRWKIGKLKYYKAYLLDSMIDHPILTCKISSGLW